MVGVVWAAHASTSAAELANLRGHEAVMVKASQRTGLEDTAEEIKRLQRGMNDLIGLLALPAMWSGGDAAQIARVLVDTLCGMLRLDFMVLRVHDVEVARSAGSDTELLPRALADAFEAHWGEQPQSWPAVVPNPVGDGVVRISALRLGLHSALGTLVAGSRRDDFPQETERLLLTIAGNQAAIALQDAQHQREQQRIADELDRRVAQRTDELAAANRQLQAEVAERMRAEAALRDSERTLRRIINTLPATAWSTRPDGYCDFLSQRWLEYAGFSAEQAEGWGWSEVVHPDDAPGLVTYWQGCLASGEPVDVEARMRRADGVYRWFLFRANPLRDETGTIVKWYGTNIDIEDRKRADAALRASELSLRESERDARLIVDCIPGLVAVLGVSGQILQVNSRMAEFFGDSVKVLSEWKTSDIVPPDELPQVVAGMAKSFETAQPFQMENRLRRHDGVYRWFQVRGSPLLGENGRADRWYFLVIDIEERKRAEEALQRLARVNSSLSLGALTASIAHEINQPLSGIVTNASTCVRLLTADPPNVQSALETARRTIRDGNRAAEMVARLRALFSNKPIATEIVDLNDVAREVIALLSNDLQRSRVTVQTELERDALILTGDRVQLQQVIVNLVRNASEAMVDVGDRPRQLLIRTERDPVDHVRLTVRDVGVGLAPTDVEKVFDAFYTTKNDSMGIGLSVSRSIIERHRGRLWATPNAGPGVTFAFSIPCTNG